MTKLISLFYSSNYLFVWYNKCVNTFMYIISLCFYTFLQGKDPDAGKDWGQEEKGATEDEMAGWHH